MNPVRGIETGSSLGNSLYLRTFQINESRSRDWNHVETDAYYNFQGFQINESRSRDWNYLYLLYMSVTEHLSN